MEGEGEGGVDTFPSPPGPPPIPLAAGVTARSTCSGGDVREGRPERQEGVTQRPSCSCCLIIGLLCDSQ